MLALVTLLLTAQPVVMPGTPAAAREEIRQVEKAKHGPHTTIDSILIKGSYALVHGNGFHDGLALRDGKWRVVCDLRAGTEPAALQSSCGFPEAVAIQLSADEPVNIAVASGNFSSAAAAEKHVYASASGPARDNERARMQLLQQLNEQMRIGQITRQQAIQQWSNFKYSWSLP